MKIDSTAPVRAPSLSRARANGRSGVGFADLLGEAQSAPAATKASPLNATEAMLALQEVGDVLERRRRARERGNAMLDRLEAIRFGLLDGRLGSHELVQLRRLVSDRQGDLADPRLGEILDDIELRAAVELAKLEQVS
ncbi:MAG: flagellar assembly protein FliX [Dongiaceae bacterium]